LESKKLYELLFELKRRLDEIEIRVKSLEKENKDTQFNNSQLVNDLAKAREREQVLERFLTSSLTLFTSQSQNG
jgi:chaperonin cofactor prefoldin